MRVISLKIKHFSIRKGLEVAASWEKLTQMASIDTINGPKMGPEVFSGCFRLLSSPWVQIHVRGKQIAMHNFFGTPCMTTIFCLWVFHGVRVLRRGATGSNQVIFKTKAGT